MLTRRILLLALVSTAPLAAELNIFSGNAVTVSTGTVFAITVQATDSDGHPQPGVDVSVAAISPGSPAIACQSASISTSADGLAVITCTAGTVTMQTVATIVVGDSLGRMTQPPFTIIITPPGPPAEGLHKVSGDGQVVAPNAAFPLPLVVSDFDPSGPQTGLMLSVNVSPPGAVFCQPAGTIDSNGFGPINCIANAILIPTVVQVHVSDSLGNTLDEPFNATVTPSASFASGLTKVSGDNQIVPMNSVVPNALVVSVTLNGFPQAGASVQVTATPASAIACQPFLTTAANGLASIACSTLEVSVPTQVRIFVTDGFGQGLASPFNLSVSPSASNSEGLTVIAGNNQTVMPNADFRSAIVIRSTVDGVPQIRSSLFVRTSPPGVVACPGTVMTDSVGHGSFICKSFSVQSTTFAQINVTDALGRSLSPPVAATVTPFSFENAEGVTKVSGDNQVVSQLASLTIPLVVQVVKDGLPRANAQLNISTSLPARLFCPAIVFTDFNGLASISCGTATVQGATIVEIFVETPDGDRIDTPFSVTIVPATFVPADDLVLLSAAEFIGRAGETVVDAVEVRAIDAAGDPVEGAPIVFSSINDVSFDPPATVTNADGIAKSSVKLGCISGRGVIAIGQAGESPSLAVSFRATPADPFALPKVQGDNQSGIPGEMLRDFALVVKLEDACGNGIRGESVAWSVDPPDAAELFNVVDTTSSRGGSSTLVNLGARPGPFTVTAISGPYSAVFTLNVIVQATRLVPVSGANQTVALGQTTANPLIVEAQDDAGNPAPGTEVTFAIVQGSGSIVGDATAKTDLMGRAEVLLAAGETLGDIRVEARAAGRTVTFFIITIGRLPFAEANAFVNGASYRPGWTPGSLGTIFGVGLTEVIGVVLGGAPPFPTTLAGVRVFVNGEASPILAISNINGEEQVSIQVPFGLPAGPTTVTIENNGSSASFPGIPLTAVQPGIFEIDVEGGRLVAALHADFNLVTPANPARPGEVILLFVTGLGPTETPLMTNQVGPIPAAATVVHPVVGIDDQGAEVLGSYFAPNLLTVYQINFKVLLNPQSGNRKISVVADGIPSQDALMPIGP